MGANRILDCPWVVTAARQSATRRFWPPPPAPSADAGCVGRPGRGPRRTGAHPGLPVVAPGRGHPLTAAVAALGCPRLPWRHVTVHSPRGGGRPSTAAVAAAGCPPSARGCPWLPAVARALHRAPWLPAPTHGCVQLRRGSPWLPLPTCVKLKAMRILVVEDEKRIADFLCRGLEGAGYAVDAAPTAPWRSTISTPPITIW